MEMERALWNAARMIPNPEDLTAKDASLVFARLPTPDERT
jgi:hypothetical protein